MATVETAAPASAKQQFLDTHAREVATTLNVLRAFPPEQGELRPAGTLKTARELAWMFTLEQGASAAAVTDSMTFPPVFPPAPGTLAEVIASFEQASRQLRELVQDTPDNELGALTQFYVAPKTLGEMPKLSLLWFMLSDMIHHRGQLSVYLRMAGGRVPSIYGPSADEPWF